MTPKNGGPRAAVSALAQVHSRVPPQNRDAERSLIGGLFEQPAKLEEIAALLTTADFFGTPERKVYEAMLRCKEDGAPIDRVSVKEHIDPEELRLIGGDKVFDELSLATPVSSNLAYYAKIIREKSIMRRTIEFGSLIVQLGYEAHGSAAEFLGEVEQRWSAIQEAAANTDESSAFVLFLPVVDFFAKCGERVEYILEPYLPKASFVIVGGAPKSGKTWFVGWLACEIAKAGKTVMFVEEEGSKETLRERLQPFLTAGAALHVAHRKGFRLDDDRSVNRLIEEVKVAGAQVLILDPLVQLHGHVRQMGDVPAEVIQAIQRIIRETGCAVVLIHHTRKGESWKKSSTAEAESAELAGSYAWAGSADNIIQIKAVPNTERRPGEVRFYIENSDTRNGEPFPRRLAVVKVNARGDADAMTFVEPESQNKAEIRRLLPYIPFEPEVITVDDLRDEAGGNAERVRSAIRFAVGDQIVGRRKGKNGGVYRVKNDRLVGDGRKRSAPSTDHRLDSIEESAEGSAWSDRR